MMQLCSRSRLLWFLWFLVLPHGVDAAAGCHNDRDKDNRLRLNCTAMGFTRVPEGIEPSTQVFIFPQNQFSDLLWNSFTDFTKLHEIDLSGNQIDALSSPFLPRLRLLAVLRLGSNRLRLLQDHSFSTAPALMELYLNHNLLHSLGNQAFSGLSRLEILDLSNNILQTLPPLMMDPLVAIETLYLEGNKIQVLPDDWFSPKEEVLYLYLSANPWACSCSHGYLRRYLEEYEGNVYVRDGPIISMDPDSVTCDSPQHLRGAAIIKLEESDFCGTSFNSTITNTFTTTTTATTTTATTTAATTANTTATTTTTPVHVWFDPGEILRGDGRKRIKTTKQPLAELPPSMSATPPSSTPPSLTSLSLTSPTVPAPSPPENQDTTSLRVETVETTPSNAFDVSMVSMVSRVESGGKVGHLETRVAFCFWLFVSLVFLCVVSGVCSVITAFRLVFWYRGVYKSLKCIVAGKEQVRMTTYCGNVEKHQTRFQTVLFVDMNQSQEVCVNLGPKAWTGEGNNAVYKQEKYCVISKQEEIEAKDVLVECQASRETNQGVSKKRYSVILREEGEKDGGGIENCDWVVGGWEVERGAASNRSWGEWLGQILPSMPWGVSAPKSEESDEEK